MVALSDPKPRRQQVPGATVCSPKVDPGVTRIFAVSYGGRRLSEGAKARHGGGAVAKNLDLSGTVDTLNSDVDGGRAGVAELADAPG